MSSNAVEDLSVAAAAYATVQHHGTSSTVVAGAVVVQCIRFSGWISICVEVSIDVAACVRVWSSGCGRSEASQAPFVVSLSLSLSL